MFLQIKQLFTALPLQPIYAGLHTVHYKQNPFKCIWCLQQQTLGTRHTACICASCSRVLVHVIIWYENHWLPHPTSSFIILTQATLPNAPLCSTVVVMGVVVVVVRSDKLQLSHQIIPCSVRYSKSQFVTSVTQITPLSSQYKNEQWGKLGSRRKIQYTLYTCSNFLTKEISCLFHL
jgi:hypothetical protein